MDKLSGIYVIANRLNGDFYVGSSVNTVVRWRQHLYVFKQPAPPTRSFLFNAVRKYGVENFVFEVIETCEPVKAVLLAREQFYIDTLLPIYNILPMAGSRLGSKQSPETIARQIGRKIHTAEHKLCLSERFTAYMNDPVNKKRYRALREGKDWEELFGEERSQEIRSRMSASRKLSPTVCAGWNAGIPLAQEHKDKLFAGRDAWLAAGNRPDNLFEPGRTPYNLGVPHTEEAKQKISASLKGREVWNKGILATEEFKKQVSASRTGKGLGRIPHNKGIKTGPQSEETCRKKSENRTGKQLGPRGPRTEETKRRCSESQKGKPREWQRGKVNPKTTHGHYGISPRKTGRWRVTVGSKPGGSYATIEEAIVARDLSLGQMDQGG